MLTTNDPTDGAVVAQFPAGSAADADAAVAAARAAQPAWAALSMDERIAQLTAFIDAVEERVDAMAEWERREMGKPIAIGAQFIRGSIASFRGTLAKAADYSMQERIPAENGTTVIRREARGVIAEIVPWNFNIAQILGGLAALLVVGNTVVIKPSEKATPSTIELFEANSLPAGVLNLLLGDGRSGAPLAAHPDIDGVLFTGSVATGRKIAAAAGENLNPVTLELGGKDAAIVDSDVNIPEVAANVAFGGLLNSGQICASIERLYVHEDIADDFITELQEAVKAFAPGGDMELGPLVDESQRTIVHTHVQDAIAKGARVLQGGELPEGPGYYYPITLLEDVNPDMLVETQETFGPVIAITRVKSFQEGLEKASASEYGLMATAYSNTPEHIEDAFALPVGYLCVNGWQGSAGVRLAEPHGISGLGPVGNIRSLDNATLVRTIFVPGTAA
jgi:acyl-CoA reductase-like NAD-dependent aldehyde dehydrogenase